jgi:hypothetical protein
MPIDTEEICLAPGRDKTIERLRFRHWGGSEKEAGGVGPLGWANSFDGFLTLRSFFSWQSVL